MKRTAKSGEWKVWIAALVCVLTSSAVAVAIECRVCEVKLSRIRHFEEQKRQTTELLGKNNAYLAMLSSEQASKFLKVRSNVTQILKKLDSIKKESEQAEGDYARVGCLDCAQGRIPASSADEKKKEE